MIDKYLPVGSVVLLKGGQKRIMIIGRAEKEQASGRSWDYLACPYPEGFLGPENAYLCDHDQIDRVFFIGFQDGEELAYAEQLQQVAASSGSSKDDAS
jgi:hypothetical protein